LRFEEPIKRVNYRAPVRQLFAREVAAPIERNDFGFAHFDLETAQSFALALPTSTHSFCGRRERRLLRSGYRIIPTLVHAYSGVARNGDIAFSPLGHMVGRLLGVAVRLLAALRGPPSYYRAGRSWCDMRAKMLLRLNGAISLSHFH
jgi:hypothetical protein